MGDAQADALALDEQLRGPFVGGAAEVGHAHDGELQTLGGMDAHQADGVAVGQRRSVRLAGAFLFLQVGDVVEEAPQVATIALLKAACQARELVGVGELSGLPGAPGRSPLPGHPGRSPLLEHPRDQLAQRPQRGAGAFPLGEHAEARERELVAGCQAQLGAGSDRQLEGPPAALLGGEREQRHAVV